MDVFGLRLKFCVCVLSFPLICTFLRHQNGGKKDIKDEPNGKMYSNKKGILKVFHWELCHNHIPFLLFRFHSQAQLNCYKIVHIYSSWNDYKIGISSWYFFMYDLILLMLSIYLLLFILAGNRSRMVMTRKINNYSENNQS